MSSIADKTFSIFKRDLLMFATKILTSILIARILGPTSLGIWVILSMIPAYAEAFARTKTDLAAVYFIGKKSFRREDLLLNMNIIALVSSCLVIFLILWKLEPLYFWLFSKETGDYQNAIKLLILQIPLQFLYLTYSYFHIAEENIKIYNRMVVIQAWGNSVFALGFLIFTSLGIWSVIIALLLGTSCALVYGIYAIDRKDWNKGKADFKLVISMLKYGFNFYIAGLIGQLQQTGTNLLALGNIVPAQLAFLSQGQGIGQLLQKVVEPANTIVFPRISRSDGITSIELSCGVFRISLLLMLPFGILLGILSKQIISLLYGNAFLPSASIVLYLLPGLVSNGVGGTLTSFFNGTGRAKLIPILMFFPVALQLFLAWFLLPHLGISGAAIAISIGLFTYGILITLVFLNINNLSIKVLIPKYSDVKFIFSFIRTNIMLKYFEQFKLLIQ